MKQYWLIFIIFYSCSKIDLSKSDCEKNGEINFMMIETPCVKAIEYIERFLDNERVLEYDIIIKEGFIIINYCYDRKYQSNSIESLLIKKEIIVKQKLNANQKSRFESLYCH